ncbi:MAG: diguanylate cyclase [Deltaproteobacteria bacterium]|nr:diguanylate cyclase [Deltaproteobacteria bacterium]
MADSPLNVLYVDQNKSFAQTTEGILKQGFRKASFSFVQNNKTALTHLKEHPVDLVLLGHHPKKNDGFRLMEDIRKKAIDTPVIMISREANERTAVEAMKRGAYDYLSEKELDVVTLKSAIRNAISRKRTERRNRRADQRIREQATRDGLTGLYNHRYFQKIMNREYKQARRYEYPLYCIMLDLDDFKGVNDTFGHLFGDTVLKESAAILKGQMRDIDLLARYGGEEFAVILTHIHAKGVLSLCERVREAFAQHTFAEEDHSTVITISIGIASLQDPRVDGPSTLVRHADEALYEAKNRGKNTVCQWREKESLYKGLQGDYREKIEYYQKQFLGFTREILDKFLDYSRKIVDDIEKKDHKTAQHSAKVTRYAVDLARALHLSEGEIHSIRLAGILHDIGKAGIDQKILTKKGTYTPRESRIMKLHPLFSVKMIEPFSFLDQEMQIILQHHERFDGKGYPTGRKGWEIKRGARILALCDAYDAMTSGRSYKKKQTLTEGCREIERNAGTQFDPEMAKVFLRMIEKTHET